MNYFDLYGEEDKPLIYEDTDGAVTIRASGLGQCDRVFWAMTQGLQPEPFTDATLAIFAEGNRLEDLMAERLRGEGVDLRAGQDQQELWIIPGKLKIKGHVDGIEYKGGVPHKVWENKALGESSYAKFQSKGPRYSEDYAWQISVYMHSTGLPSLYTAIRRYSPRELEENPELVQDEAEHTTKTLRKPPYTMNEIKLRAIRIYKMWKNITPDMPPCDQRYFCSFKFLHDEAEDKFVPTRSNPKYDQLATDLQKARADKKKATDWESRIKDEITILAPDEQEEILEGEMLAIEKQVISTSRMDKGKLLEDLGIDEEELKEKYYTESSYIKLNVKKKGPKW